MKISAAFLLGFLWLGLGVHDVSARSNLRNVKDRELERQERRNRLEKERLQRMHALRSRPRKLTEILAGHAKVPERFRKSTSRGPADSFAFRNRGIPSIDVIGSIPPPSPTCCPGPVLHAQVCTLLHLAIGESHLRFDPAVMIEPHVQFKSVVGH